MSIELYFLRSSESKIVENMLQYTHLKKDEYEQYSSLYGLTTKDLGLYALEDNKIAGAIWSREIDGIPIINLAVLTKQESKKIATTMLNQYLLEAAAVYEKVFLRIDEDTKDFYTKFGFKQSTRKELMQISLEKKELIRPTDGYDPQRWMD